MKFGKLSVISKAVSLTLVASLTLPIQAQDDQKETSDIEKVIVVGSKTSENYADIPTAVSVINSNMIDNFNLTNLRDIGRFAPNVSISQIGQVGGTFITIRGIESNPYNVSRTAVYVDGIPYADPDMLRLSNVEQIEVLRGPQSTLYGANASGGVIVITTKSPTEELSGGASIRSNHFSNGNSTIFDAHLSSRFTNELSAYANFEIEKGDSYIKNIGSSVGLTGEIENIFANLKLRYEPDVNTVFDVVVTHNELDAPGLYEQEFPAFDIDKYNANPMIGSAVTGLTVGEYEIAHDAAKRTEESETTIALSLGKTFGDLEWFSSFNYRQEEESAVGTDLDLSTNPFLFAAGGHFYDNEYINFETRLVQDLGKGGKWLLGASINNEESHRRIRSTGLKEGGFASYKSSPEQDKNLTNYSLFGQYTYLLTDNLKITAGLRYEDVQTSIKQNSGQMIVGGFLPPFNFRNENESLSDNEWLPKLSAHYEVSDSTSFYASAAKGYLPGGYNVVSAAEQSVDEISEQYGRYDPEELWSYEIGGKSSFMNDRLLFAGAVFYTDASSWQENFLVTTDAGAISSTTLLVSTAAIKSKGAEIELTFKATDQLRIMSSLGITDAKYSKYDFSDSVSYAGNRVKLIPKYDFNLSIDYNLTDNFSVTAQVRGLGETMLIETNEYVRDNLWLLDLSMRYDIGQWTTSVFVNNATSERYASGLAYSHFFFGNDGTYYASLGNPKVIGFELSYNF